MLSRSTVYISMFLQSRPDTPRSRYFHLKPLQNPRIWHCR